VTSDAKERASPRSNALLTKAGLILWRLQLIRQAMTTRKRIPLLLPKARSRFAGRITYNASDVNSTLSVIGIAMMLLTVI
jgi:hypothetical protein